jgi:hypothetical protein
LRDETEAASNIGCIVPRHGLVLRVAAGERVRTRPLSLRPRAGLRRRRSVPGR